MPTMPKKSFSQYLIDSDFTYLTFIGKTMQYFGAREVAALLLGAATVYLYAFFTQSLPFVKLSTETKTIDLHGAVQTILGKRLTDFEVAIIASRAGPFTSEGTFTVRAPLQDKYSVVVWNTDGFYPMKLYGDREVERQASGEYKLPLLTDFPANLGFVQGTVFDSNKRPVDGFVEIGGKRLRIGSDGSFELHDIPLGRLKLRVLKPDLSPLQEEDIEVNKMGLTPEEIIVATQQ